MLDSTFKSIDLKNFEMEQHSSFVQDMCELTPTLWLQRDSSTLSLQRISCFSNLSSLMIRLQYLHGSLSLWVARCRENTSDLNAFPHLEHSTCRFFECRPTGDAVRFDIIDIYRYQQFQNRFFSIFNSEMYPFYRLSERNTTDYTKLWKRVRLDVITFLELCQTRFEF